MESENHNIENKETWRDEYLIWISLIHEAVWNNDRYKPQCNICRSRF